MEDSSAARSLIDSLVFMPMLRLTLILLPAIGCTGDSGPSSVSETSAARPTLEDRIDFVEQYVTFRRTYEQLEYDIRFASGGSFPPGPSDWDVRIVAQVPSEQMDRWAIPGKRDLQMTTPDWVATTASDLNVDAITEWYTDGGRSVGIDRKNNIVAYRNFAN